MSEETNEVVREVREGSIVGNATSTWEDSGIDMVGLVNGIEESVFGKTREGGGGGMGTVLVVSIAGSVGLKIIDVRLVASVTVKVDWTSGSPTRESVGTLRSLLTIVVDGTPGSIPTASVLESIDDGEGTASTVGVAIVEDNVIERIVDELEGSGISSHACPGTSFSKKPDACISNERWIFCPLVPPFCDNRSMANSAGGD